MHLSLAFWFGLTTGVNLYLALWLFILFSRLWHIEITNIEILSGFFRSRAYTTEINGTKLTLDYVPISVGVRYLGMLEDDYREMFDGEKQFAYLYQSKLRRFILESIPIAIALLSIGAGILLFDMSEGFSKNLSTVSTYLEQIFRYSLWMRTDLSSIHLSSLSYLSLLALVYVYYGVMSVIYLIVARIMSSEALQGKGEILMYILLFLLFLLSWFRIPWSIASLLSVSWQGILSGIFQYLIAISLWSSVNVLLLHLFLRKTSGLTYRRRAE